MLTIQSCDILGGFAENIENKTTNSCNSIQSSYTNILKFSMVTRPLSRTIGLGNLTLLIVELFIFIFNFMMKIIKALISYFSLYRYIIYYYRGK